MNHELVQHEDGTLGVKAPEVYESFFTVDKPFKAEMAVGEGKISGNNITLTAEKDSYSVADMGTRPASMTLECDVTIDEDGCAGFAFGGSEKDATYTALCLDARQNLLHYDGSRHDGASGAHEIRFFKGRRPSCQTGLRE